MALDTSRPRRLGYAVAVGATAVLVGLRLVLDSWLGDRAPLLPLLAAVALAAWVGGLGAGLLATALGTLAGGTLLLPDTYAFRRPGEFLHVAMFLAVGGVISGLCEALHRVRRREARQRDLFERITTASPDVIYLYDLATGRNVYSNPQLAAVLGYSPEQLAGSGDGALAHDRVHPDDREQLAADHRRFDKLEDGEVFDYTFRMRHADGSYRLLRCRHAVFERDAAGRAKVVLGVAQDVTDRNRAEEAVRASERRLEVVLAGINDHLVCYDRQWRYTYVNDKAGEILGRPKDELLGRSIWDLFPDAVGNQYHAELHRALAEQRVIRSEHYYAPFDAWFENHIYPTPDGVTVFASDVTWRKRAEQALRESEAVFRTLGEALPDFLWMSEADGRPIYQNPAWHEYTGLTHADLGRDGWEVMAHPDDRPRLKAGWADAVAAGRGFEVEYRCRRHDGAYRWFLSRTVPVRDDGRVVKWVGTATDIHDRKVAEEQLRRNHDTFFTLIENAPFGVYVVDADFRLRQVSAGSQRVFANVRPLLGRDFAEVLRIIWPEPFAAEAIGRFRHTLATGEPYAAPNTTERRHDIPAVESYDWKIEQVTLPDGQFGVVCYFYDITERRLAEGRLRASEERFRQLADAMPQIVFAARPDGTVDYFNRRWYEYTGLPDDGRVEDESWVAVHEPAGLARVAEVWGHALRTGEPYEIEYRLRRADGAWRWHLGRALPIRDADGRVVRWYGTNTDIHDRKQAEEALREADRRKDEFLATLAHELRNPIAPVRHGLQVIARANGNTAAVEHARAMMDRQLAHLVVLVDDLLDVSRITRGKLTLRRGPVLLVTVIEHAVEAARPLVERNGHELAVRLPPDPVVIDGDLTRLAQVVGNLLTNSAKYTPRGGRITLTAARDAGGAVVTVADTGVGIPQEDLGRVFGLFTQVDRALEKTTGGLGIGLALVKGLVEMHGGTVAAASDGEGKGSTFTVRLPVAAGVTPVGSGAVVPTPQTPPRPLKILVVDDNEDGAESLATLLEMIGNQVRVAHDGLQAVELAEAFRPDVILMDVGLPKLNGLDATRRIRHAPWGRAIRVVALTGWGQDGDRERSAAAGCDGHLVKPVELATLTELLAKLTTNR